MTEDIRRKTNQNMMILILIMGAFIVHIVSALFYIGHEMDIYCFANWSGLLYDHGIGAFYTLTDEAGNPVFNDYPPGYMYVLWVIGALYKLFNISFDLSNPASAIILKMPAMICDLGIGYVIYLIAGKYTKRSKALLFAAVYMFNPVIILNSSLWGQVDSILTLCVLLMCYFVTEKKLIIAYFIFAIGILIKPQALIFTPVLIYGIIDQVFLEDFSVKRMLKHLLFGISAIGMLFLLALPFGISEVISQYVDTLGSYKYATVNAYNIWALFGKNWVDQNTIFFFLPCKIWGTVAIIGTVVVSTVFCLKNKDNESKYYMTGAFIVTAMFMLSVRMHERYMYPALALFLAAAIVKRRKNMFYVFAALCFVHFLNTAHVLSDYLGSQEDIYKIQIMSLLTVFTFVFMCVVLMKDGFKPRLDTHIEKIKQKNDIKNDIKNDSRNIMPSFISSKWVRADFIIMIAITLIYACVAFYRLGDFNAPQSEWYGKQGDEIVLDFGETKSINKMFTYLGYYENREFEVFISTNGEQWEQIAVSNETGYGNVKVVSVFAWNEQQFSKDTRYIKFVLVNDVASVMEFMFYDNEGKVLTPVNTADYKALFDEQEIFDGKYSYMNSTYFDEIYHARTAYEMLHGLKCYETTHPPLGKMLMSIGIGIFGMCPFGWRFMGALFGVLMLPVMYLLARKITDKTWVAGICTGLYALDFMHFTQTRIATIDVFAVLFIMLEYYFMLKYYRMSFYDTPFKKTLTPLFLSGVCMGLGCASKWTGVYAGIGLAVIFFAVMLKRYMEYKKANENYKGYSSGILHKNIVENYTKYTLKTLLFCIVAFVIVPLAIYALSYIPVNDGTGNNFIVKMINSQKSMLWYHSESVIDSTHPYSSAWFKWPTMMRPILYYVENVGNGMAEAISAFGNPMIWWIGIFAFFYMMYRAYRKSDRIALFIAIAALVQYVPWMFIKRCTFIYHYFPTVPFLVLTIGYSIYHIVKGIDAWAVNSSKNGKLVSVPLIVTYMLLVLIVFIAFYPVISGNPMSVDAGKYLKWFNDWVLIK